MITHPSWFSSTSPTRLVLARCYLYSMLRMRARLAGFIEPCLPSPAPNPPAGDGWIHEIKLDGFRMLARRDGAGVRLLTRRGIDWTTRYPRRRRGSRLPLLLDRWRGRDLRRGWRSGVQLRPLASKFRSRYS